MIVIYILLGLIALFVAVILCRTFAFRPEKKVEYDSEKIEFDENKAVKNLQTLVKFKTVSNYDKTLEDDNEFEGLIAAFPDLYPEVIKNCELKRFDGRALLFKWKGKSSSNPTVLMAHYDVVPVNADAWTVDPFAAVIKDGALWGRGTLDTKVTFNGAMTAADNLMASGFVPESDIYFAFSGGEEVNGPGAVNIVNYFSENGIVPSLVVDEGGAVVKDVFPGVKEPCGLIGIAEKGMMDVEYKCKSQGGHASAPKPHTPVGILSAACVKIENNPFKSHLTKPVEEMFSTLGRRSSFLYRMIFANLWCFKGVIDGMCKKSGGELNALMRTTVAFTKASGSKASNVIPPEATMISNIRLNPEDTMESALGYLKKTVDDENVEISCVQGMNPSRISDTNCDGWRKISNAVGATWKGCIVSPYLMVQCSDSRHYGRITDKVYRFSAMDLTSDERSSIHGNDEHIRLETISRSVEFYMRLISQC